jgi:phage protein D
MASLSSVKFRRGTEYAVSLPTLPSLNLTPSRVELIQKPYHHDVLILEFFQTSSTWFEIVKTGVPIQFSWKQGQYKTSWIGYVSFVNKKVAGQIQEPMEVHCIGSTFPLKERTTKVFENSTISKAVESIVMDFGFKFVGEDNGVVFDQLTIAGHSYWEWIQEQAKRIGYGVLVDQMTFYFRPLDKLINQNITNVPVLSMLTKETGINSHFMDRTLDMFKVINGEHVENLGAMRTVKTISGIDPLTSNQLTSVSSPSEIGENLKETVNDVLFSEIVSDQVTNTHDTAIALSKGAAHLGRLNMPAYIKCQGDPRIKPFAPVVVENTGSVTDGFWIAREVHHKFARVGDYQIEMKANIDGTGLNKITTTRPGTTSPVGMVNLVEAQANQTHLSSEANYSLTTKNFFVKETKQGFNRTPALWRYLSKEGN